MITWLIKEIRVGRYLSQLDTCCCWLWLIFLNIINDLTPMSVIRWFRFEIGIQFT